MAETVIIPSVLNSLRRLRHPQCSDDEKAPIEAMFGASASQVLDELEEVLRFLDPLITLFNLAGYEVDGLMVGNGPLASPDDRVLVMDIPDLIVHTPPLEYLVNVDAQTAAATGRLIGLRVIPRIHRAPDPYGGASKRTYGGGTRQVIAAPDLAILLPGIAPLQWPQAELNGYVAFAGTAAWLLRPVQEGWVLFSSANWNTTGNSVIPIDAYVPRMIALRDMLIDALLQKADTESLWKTNAAAAQRGMMLLYDPMSWIFDGTQTVKRTVGALDAPSQYLVALGDYIWSRLTKVVDNKTTFDTVALETFLREEVGAGPKGEAGTGRPLSLSDRIAAYQEALRLSDDPPDGYDLDYLDEVMDALEVLYGRTEAGTQPLLSPWRLWNPRSVSYTQLLFAALDAQLFECHALVVRPADTRWPRPGELNPLVLSMKERETALFKTGAEFNAEGGNGYQDPGNDGVSEHIVYPPGGERMLWAHEDPPGTVTGKTFCVGFTFEIFVKAWLEWYSLVNPTARVGYLDNPGLLGVAGPWYNSPGTVGPGCWFAARRFGFGIPLPPVSDADKSGAPRAQAGDFAQLLRNTTDKSGLGNGHGVIFLNWIKADESDWTSGELTSLIAGIKYWSTQSSTHGIAVSTERFNGGSWNQTDWRVYVMRAGRV